METESDDADSSESLFPEPVILPWQSFEQEVAEYIKTQFDSDTLGLRQELVKVTPRKALFSKARESDIIFDVVVEVFPPGNPTDAIIIWLWECKDYPNRRVTVDEVEELQEKRTQVGAHKATIVTRLGFQGGAIRLAKSYHIGLMTLYRKRAFAIAFSQDAGIIPWDPVTGRIILKQQSCQPVGRQTQRLVAGRLKHSVPGAGDPENERSAGDARPFAGHRHEQLSHLRRLQSKAVDAQAGDLPLKEFESRRLLPGKTAALDPTEAGFPVRRACDVL